MELTRHAFVAALLGVLSASCTPGGDGGSRESADLILTGGRIFTSNDRQPWADSVAVKDGEFIFVGDSAGVMEFQSDGTRLVQLNGRMVIPGIVDAHAHPGYIDVEQYGEISAATEEDLVAAVRQYAEDHPGGSWLRLCCWPVGLYVHGDRGPDKRVLDTAVADRPVWFVSEWWHSGWLNSRALEVLGVDKDTPDPRTGVATYVRDERGEPTGWVKEGAAWQHYARHFPIDDADHRKSHQQNVVAALQHLSELGVTTLYDAGNFGFEDVVYGYLAELEKQGKLPVRYEGTYQVFAPERRHTAVS